QTDKVSLRISHILHFFLIYCFYRRGSSATLRLGSSPCKNRGKIAAGTPATHICGHDGIGRHARFRFSCSDALGFESPCPHQLRNSLFGMNPRLAAEMPAFVSWILAA